MELPTEIRLIIAEYALASEEGLFWYWKTESTGKKTGGFKNRFQQPQTRWLAEWHYVNPITLLYLSRQLQQETSNLWARVNTLHFDGSQTAYTGDRTSAVSAVRAYEYFIRHHVTRNLPRIPTVVIDVPMFSRSNAAMCKLSEVTQHGRHPEIRVIEFSFGSTLEVGSEKGRAQSFWKRLQEVKVSIGESETLFPKRIWKIYPSRRSPRLLECLQKYLAPEDFKIAFDCIEHGL